MLKGRNQTPGLRMLGLNVGWCPLCDKLPYPLVVHKTRYVPSLTNSLAGDGALSMGMRAPLEKESGCKHLFLRIFYSDGISGCCFEMAGKVKKRVHQTFRCAGDLAQTLGGRGLGKGPQVSLVDDSAIDFKVGDTLIFGNGHICDAWYTCQRDAQFLAIIGFDISEM